MRGTWLLGALLVLPACVGGGGDTDPGPDRQRLDPRTIPKFTEPLVVPSAMPWVHKDDQRTQYEIAVRQIEQQILPEGLPATIVWAYGAPHDPSTFHAPSPTVEARVDELVEVKWINQLVDDQGRFLPHLLPVDPTLHWANPPGPIDERPTDPGPYTGPVPIVTHVHGAHTQSVSDGLPEAWYLPDAVDIPDGYAREGSRYGSVRATEPGSAVFRYPNDTRAATQWYHDHALGITRLNVYAGPAGFYLVRDDTEDALGLPGPAPAVGDAPGAAYYELPLAIQDRSFWDDGALFYPDSRAAFDGYEGPFRPEAPISPTWNPEFFGDAMIVNGHVWPFLEVEPRLYRLRILNGSNSRFLILDLDEAGLAFHQIGGEGGLLPDAPVVADTLLLAPAERADVLVDFSSLAPGREVRLLNLGPDEPFDGVPGAQDPADPETTGQVMSFRVVPPTGAGVPGAIPTELPPVAPLTTDLPARDLTLNEETFETDDGDEIPSEAELGTLLDGQLGWGDPITETPKLGSTEVWRLINLTEDAHPVHLHQVTFQVLDRTPIDAEAFAAAQLDYLAGSGAPPSVEAFASGAAVPPADGERGWTDTVISPPGEVTRLIATFDIPGIFVWHCHVLEHEDNEMMRPYEVVP